MRQNMSSHDLNKYASAYKNKSLYDLENLMTFTWYAERIISFSPSGDLLELGIGHGATIERFHSAYDRYVIIEGSEEIISSFLCKDTLPNVQIINTLFEEYDAEDTFDVVIMGFILEHVEEPGFILRRYKKFLKPQGVLYVTVPNARALHRRIGFEAGILQDIYGFNEYDRTAGHRRYFDSSSIVELVEGCGYRVERMEGLFLKPITTAQMDALNFSSEIYQALLKIGVAYPELSNSILLQLKTC